MEIKLARLEQKMEDVCSNLGELKQDLKDFIESADQKYASNGRVARLEGLLFAIGGGLIAFLVWSFKEYLKHIK